MNATGSAAFGAGLGVGLGVTLVVGAAELVGAGCALVVGAAAAGGAGAGVAAAPRVSAYAPPPPTSSTASTAPISRGVLRRGSPSAGGGGVAATISGRVDGPGAAAAALKIRVAFGRSGAAWGSGSWPAATAPRRSRACAADGRSAGSTASRRISRTVSGPACCGGTGGSVATLCSSAYALSSSPKGGTPSTAA